MFAVGFFEHAVISRIMLLTLAPCSDAPASYLCPYVGKGIPVVYLAITETVAHPAHLIIALHRQHQGTLVIAHLERHGFAYRFPVTAHQTVIAKGAEEHVVSAQYLPVAIVDAYHCHNLTQTAPDGQTVEILEHLSKQPSCERADDCLKHDAQHNLHAQVLVEMPNIGHPTQLS